MTNINSFNSSNVNNNRFNFPNIIDKPTTTQQIPGIKAKTNLNFFDKVREFFGVSVKINSDLQFNKRSAIKFLQRHTHELASALKSVDPTINEKKLSDKLNKFYLSADKIIDYLKKLDQFNPSPSQSGPLTPPDQTHQQGSAPNAPTRVQDTNASGTKPVPLQGEPAQGATTSTPRNEDPFIDNPPDLQSRIQTASPHLPLSRPADRRDVRDPSIPPSPHPVDPQLIRETDRFTPLPHPPQSSSSPISTAATTMPPARSGVQSSVHVKTVNKQEFEIELDSESTIGELKQKIAEQLQKPVEEFSLGYQGKRCDNNSKIKDISEKSYVVVIPAIKPPQKRMDNPPRSSPKSN